MFNEGLSIDTSFTPGKISLDYTFGGQYNHKIICIVFWQGFNEIKLIFSVYFKASNA